MEASVVTLNLRLEATTKKDGNQWVARCVPIDVFSQGDTKKKAIASLSEAVHLWFESCLERDVLSEALTEAGFSKVRLGENVPDDISLVQMQVTPSLSPKRKISLPEYITVEVPAYIATTQLGGLCAPRSLEGIS